MDNNKVPKNYEGLLRFCTEQTASEDTTRPTDLQPLSDEKREFLQKVFDSLAENDPIKRMIEITKKLTHNLHLHSEGIHPNINSPSTSQGSAGHYALDIIDQDDEFVSENESSIEKLIDYCENLDLANDFHKIGGFSILTPLLNSRIPSLRALTCELIATLSQNNPYGQQALLNENIVPHLVHLLSSTSVYSSNEVKIKAMYAVSCLSRFNKSLQDELLRLNLLGQILNLIDSNILKLQIKTAFLIGSLADENVDIRNHLRRINSCNIIIDALYRTNSEELKEQLLYALARVLRRNEEVEENLNSDKLIQNRNKLVVYIQNEKAKLNEDSTQAFIDNLEEIERLLQS